MWGRFAAGSGKPRGKGELSDEDTILKALERMQRGGVERADVRTRTGEVLGTIDASELHRAWSLDPLRLLRELFRPALLPLHAEDREAGMITADSLFSRVG